MIREAGATRYLANCQLHIANFSGLMGSLFREDHEICGLLFENCLFEV